MLLQITFSLSSVSFLILLKMSARKPPFVSGVFGEELKKMGFLLQDPDPYARDFKIPLNLSMNASQLRIPARDLTPVYLTQRPVSSYVYNVTILVVLTFGGDLPPDLLKSGAAIELAVKHVRQNILPNVFVDYHITSKAGFTNCYEEENHGAFLMTRAAFKDLKLQGRPRVGLLVGPACTKTLESIGRVAADMKLPIMTSQGFSSIFDNRVIFKTLTRTGFTVKTVTKFTFEFLDDFNYTNVGVIYDDRDPYASAVGSSLFRAMYFRKDKNMAPFDSPYRGVVDFREMLYKASNRSRVMFILANAPTVRRIMLEAYDLGMTNGDYVFVTCEWYKENYWGSFHWRARDSRDEDARKAYRSLFILREGYVDHKNAASLQSSSYQQFVYEAKRLSWERFGYGFGPDEELSPAVTEFVDGIFLWATALNETITNGEDPSDGPLIVRKMWNRRLQGIDGMVLIDSNGDRDSSYVLMDMDPVTGNFKDVLYYRSSSASDLQVVGEIDWNRQPNQPPPNEPECGFLNDKLICLLRNDQTNAMIGAVAGVAAALLVLSLVGVAIYRKIRTIQALKNTWWRVDFDEIKYQARAMSSMRSSIGFGDDGDAGHKLSVATYHDRPVMVRNLDRKIELTNEILMYLSKLNGITHENIVRVVGICPDLNRETVLTEFCSKGALADLLANEDIELDWGFKSSLITDLVVGLEYLHGSFLVSHGNIHSNNCVIDSRFTLKITDYAFPEFRTNAQDLVDSPEFNHKVLFWRAPEFLRALMPPSGTQKGDVYSMAIVLSEIVTRREPFVSAKGELEYEPNEIVAKVKDGYEPFFRPTIQKDDCPEMVTEVIRSCWHDNPKDRPAVKDAHAALKQNGVAKGSVVENIIRRMEQYAVNLESTVSERTKAFLEEKKKVEELLYEILPRAVADALKVGQTIAPEAFEMVTLYYSDIVGFTTISYKSTAFEVVDLLNDLYTLFDGNILAFDAYKVETIGDAYVVASGVPIRNGNQHAVEIAKMSLRFRDTVGTLKIRHLPGETIRLRIGNHSGYVAAGVVGVKMPRYCLFGETVVIANKMESSGQPMRVQISDVTKTLLDEFDLFDIEYRHEFQYGNKSIGAYWLNGLKNTPN